MNPGARLTTLVGPAHSDKNCPKLLAVSSSAYGTRQLGCSRKLIPHADYECCAFTMLAVLKICLQVKEQEPGEAPAHYW